MEQRCDYSNIRVGLLRKEVVAFKRIHAGNRELACADLQRYLYEAAAPCVADTSLRMEHRGAVLPPFLFMMDGGGARRRFTNDERAIYESNYSV